MDNQALVPEAPLLTSEEANEINADMPKAIEADKEIAALTGQAGWEKIASLMRQDIEDLRTGKSVAVDAKTPLEEVGRKFLVASAVASHLEGYLNKVEQAAMAVAEDAKRREPK